jgi:ankyrin repeat protein
MNTRRPKGEADDVNHEMWRLTKDNNWDAVKQRLVQGEWDPNRPLVLESSPSGLLLLTLAVDRGDVALARELIELGADANASMPREPKPLMEACGNGHREIVDLLLQAGADVNAKCSVSDEGDPGETPLMAAATFGHRDIVDALLKKGACIDLTTRRGRSALSIALGNGHDDLEMVRFLLEAGCSVDGRDLHYPIHKRDLEVFQLLLARQSDVNKPFDWPTDMLSPAKQDAPLFVAVDALPEEQLGVAWEAQIKRTERMAILELLLQAGADVNAQRGGKSSGWTSLMIAVGHDDAQIAKCLIAAGADPTKEVVTTRHVPNGDTWKRLKGPISAIGFAAELPNNKKTTMLLLGHE